MEIYKNKRTTLRNLKVILVITCMFLFIQSVPAMENTFMGSVNIAENLTIKAGHVMISGGDLHLDGSLIHDLGSVSFTNGNFSIDGDALFINPINKRIGVGTLTPITKLDVNGSVRIVGSLDIPEISNTLGNLKIQPDVQGDVVLFGDTQVGDSTDGKELKVFRKAAEGNSYIRFYIVKGDHAMIHSDTNIYVQNADGKNIQLNSGQHVYLNLGDSAGSDEVRIRDNGGLEVGTIDSNGNVWYRGDLSIGISSDVLIQANGDSYFNGGNVGIGGLIPNSKLSIIGNESGDHTNDAGLAMQNTATGGDTWYLRTGANGTYTPSGGFSIADTTSYRLVIDENGKVGIGTISPSYKLEVNGNVSLKDSLYVVGSGFVGIGTSTPGLPLEVRSADDNQGFFFDSRSQAQGVGGGIAFGGKYNDAGGEAMAGRIGVQKTNGVSGDVGFNMVFETQDWEGSITERLILQSDGKVGIGVENPTKTLHVGGDTYIVGELETDNGIIINGNIQANSDVIVSGNITLGEKITFAFGEIIDNVVNGWIKITGNLEVTGSVNVDSYTLFVDSVDNKVGIGTSDPKEELHIKSIHPVITFEESDAASNEKNWEVGANGEEFKIQTANDLHTGTQTVLRIGDRAGTGTGFVEFPMGEIRIDDLEGSYTNGEAAVCVYNNGTLFVRDGGCN